MDSVFFLEKNLKPFYPAPVFAGGNDYSYGADVNFDGLINSRYTVSVGATGKNGLRKYKAILCIVSNSRLYSDKKNYPLNIKTLPIPPLELLFWLVLPVAMMSS